MMLMSNEAVDAHCSDEALEKFGLKSYGTKCQELLATSVLKSRVQTKNFRKNEERCFY